MSSFRLSRRSAGRATLLALALGAPSLQVFASDVFAATPPVYTELAPATAATGYVIESKLAAGPDGLMYGTAHEGGANGAGSVFRIEADGSVTVLHSFAANGSEGVNPVAGLVLGADGWLYGPALGTASTYGSIYKVSAAGEFTVVHAFTAAEGVGSPTNALAQGADGSFYGTAIGSAAKYGAVFKVSTDGQFTLVYKFKDQADGEYPESPLLLGRNGLFYGTTASSSASSSGTVFSLRADGHLRTLHTFPPTAPGCIPQGNLAQADDGEIYGITSECGSTYDGTVYGVSPQGVFEVLHDFAAGDPLGTMPRGGLSIDADGHLYGTTFSGGGNGGHAGGTVYSMTRNGAARVLHTFQRGNVDGMNPAAAPTVAPGGLLYGTTVNGGGQGMGELYEVQLSQ